ncbi:MAG: response regulator, partial [Pseudomonadota bacterium]
MPRILYVEDNEDNVYMLTRRLKRKGFEILVARDGQEGVTMARSERPDLILRDLNMPVMDGWEATRALKAAEDTKAIPIIALSAHAMAGDRDRAIEAGCDDYDTKPVRIDSLIGKIGTLLPGT